MGTLPKFLCYFFHLSGITYLQDMNLSSQETTSHLLGYESLENTTQMHLKGSNNNGRQIQRATVFCVESKYLMFLESCDLMKTHTHKKLKKAELSSLQTHSKRTLVNLSNEKICSFLRNQRLEGAAAAHTKHPSALRGFSWSAEEDLNWLTNTLANEEKSI